MAGIHEKYAFNMPSGGMILWRAAAMQWTVFYWRHIHGNEYGRKPANDTQRLGEVLLPRQR
jgi:hypothetical protein